MNRNSKTPRFASIEVGSSQLHVCVVHTGADGTPRCETTTKTWRREADSLRTEQGQSELTEALRRVSADLRLAGTSTWVALTGDYCVTRVISGTNEYVRREIAELEQRSCLYLSLGHGAKALAANFQPIDARHSHALLSVVNQNTIDVVAQ